MTRHPVTRSSLRAVAIFEASKGILVLSAGSGLLLVHRDLQAFAERLVAHLHLDPASHYPRIFLRLAGDATPGGVQLLALGAAVYSLIRFAEAIGLWHDRSWAEWLGVITAGTYLPFELFAFARHPGPGSAVAIILNVAVVVLLARRLGERRRRPAPV